MTDGKRIEIERKFLVSGDGWRAAADAGRPIVQGYLCGGDRGAVRVRIDGEKAFLTVKAVEGGDLRVRREYEYPIPMADARELLRLCAPRLVEKRRYRVDWDGRTWEVDCFEGANAGLVLAEIELDDPAEPLTLPPWVGKEVSDDPRFLNVRLAEHPLPGGERT